MPKTVVLLSIPGLRAADVGSMSRLRELSRKGISVPLLPSFPAVTCAVQASLTTGVGLEQHGVVGDSFYLRDSGKVERRPVGNELVLAPQLWETLRERDSSMTSAVWFAALSNGAKADFLCAPAVDDLRGGNALLECFSKPAELYGTLRDAMGVFPLADFRGPNPGIKSTAWIVDSFVQSAYVLKPRFSFVCLPHLECAAVKFGPDSGEALAAVPELDMAIGALVDGLTAAGIRDVTWVAASEYCVTPVSTIGFPNRVLREAGLFTPAVTDGDERLVPRETPAFALADHQLAHVYVRDAVDIGRVADVLRQGPSVADVLVGNDRSKVGLNHPRSGEIVLIAKPDASFADDLRLDGAVLPLDATPVKGTHGALETEAARQGVLISSESAAWFSGKEAGIRDVDVAGLVTSLFGVS